MTTTLYSRFMFIINKVNTVTSWPHQAANIKAYGNYPVQFAQY